MDMMVLVFVLDLTPDERMRIASTVRGHRRYFSRLLVTLKFTGDCVLRIEADSNNSEEDNPLIWMSQDGNSSYNCKIGMVGSAGQIYTNHLKIWIYISI